MKTVVMLSPGFPREMTYFTRALAAAGARVIGVGDQPVSDLPDAAREALAHYEHVSLADDADAQVAERQLGPAALHLVGVVVAHAAPVDERHAALAHDLAEVAAHDERRVLVDPETE